MQKGRDMCMSDSFWCTVETNTQHSKATIFQKKKIKKQNRKQIKYLLKYGLLTPLELSFLVTQRSCLIEQLNSMLVN